MSMRGLRVDTECGLEEVLILVILIGKIFITFSFDNKNKKMLILCFYLVQKNIAR